MRDDFADYENTFYPTGAKSADDALLRIFVSKFFAAPHDYQ